MTEEPLAEWEGGTARELEEEWSSPSVHLFRTLGSTNDVARRLAGEGAPHGTVVLAEEQRAGRGRVGRGWSSASGLGLWLSLVVRPMKSAAPGPLPIVVGLTAAVALDPFVQPSRVQVKWPNDLVARGRKLGGILCEASWEGGRTGAYVVGVGINALHRESDFPAEVRPHATSLLALAGEADRRRSAGAVISALIRRLARSIELGPADLAAWRERDALAGLPLRVTEPTSGVLLAEGRSEGIAADGALLVRTPEGALSAIRSGTVRAAG